MRLLGYCLSCHRVRYVTVTSYVNSGFAYGKCSQCEREEEEERARRRGEGGATRG